MSVPTVKVLNPTFGKPLLRSANNGSVKWTKDNVLSQWQKGTGWQVSLTGGEQTGGASWAAAFIPTEGLRVKDLTQAMWSYYMTNAEAHGANIVVWAHSNDDFSKRVEITQSGAATGLGKASGWNSHKLVNSTAQFFFYGENSSDSPLTAGTLYTWNQFREDVAFRDWIIYRVSFEMGWYTTGVFDEVWLAEVTLNGIVIPLLPPAAEQISSTIDNQLDAVTTVPTWKFGAPVLRTGANGLAGWLRAEGSVEGLLQKGASGIIANLYGGLQTGGASWAAVYVPVNEMPTLDFNSAQWTYRLADAEAYGHNMVIWAHDPDDLGNRVEITQAPSGATLASADGWNDHTLNTSTTQFFYYGEGVSGSGLSAGTQYTWAQFQDDVVFSTWKIYRISIEYGWYSTGTFGESWLAELILNGQVILLQPGPGETMGREVKSFTKATANDSTDDVTLVTPGTGRRIKVLSLNMITASATAANFECYFSVADAMPAAKVIAVRNLDTDAVAEHFVSFGDDGPVGLVDEIVSMRTSADITTNGVYTIVYREV